MKPFDLEEDVQRIEASYSRLKDWTVESLQLGRPGIASEMERARNNLIVLDQALLHRAEKLLSAASVLISEQNIHGLAHVSRGYLEGVAQLGWLCDRLHALEAHNITFDDFHQKLANVLLGAGDPSFTEAPKPLNIMTCIEKADRYYNRKVEVPGPEVGIIRGCYDWLSDFCHPNFLSSALSHELDTNTGYISFRHLSIFSKKDVEIVRYLSLSSDLFTLFHDELNELREVLSR